jgi:16S rRNA (guanine1207-N2)-methyltransferase
LVPGAQALERAAPGSLSAMTMLAPPGTVERRYAIAAALRALAPGAPFTLAAHKTLGGQRLRKEVEAFGCEVTETSKAHHRICHTIRLETPTGVDEALADGAPRIVASLGLWSQPGVFSWDRADPGSALLAANLPPLKGEGADLGCGIGFLSRAVLASPEVKALHMIDIDRRAIEAAQHNVLDPRASFLWSDIRAGAPALAGLDFAVVNPPFHDAGREDQSLGQAFVQYAARVLRKGGTLWLVANRHLPYEATLADAFRTVTSRAEAQGFKVYEAVK